MARMAAEMTAGAGNDAGEEIVAALSASMTEEQHAMRRMEFEIFNSLSGTACPSIENIEKYEPQIMAEMARRAREGYSL